jgi:hypothetical protein
MLFYFIFEINILINEFNYEKFQHFFLVSLLSGVVTLGSYKLLFDTNGYFSNENGLVTMASNSYGKSGLSTDVLDFTEAAEKQFIPLFT